MVVLAPPLVDVENELPEASTPVPMNQLPFLKYKVPVASAGNAEPRKPVTVSAWLIEVDPVAVPVASPVAARVIGWFPVM